MINLIKKLILEQTSLISEMGLNDVTLKFIMDTYDNSNDNTKQKISIILSNNPNKSRDYILNALRDMDYYEINQIKKRIKELSLNEIKSLDGYNQYYKGLVDKQNQEKDLSTYNIIVRLDPTFIDNTENLGQYAKWLLRKDNLAWILNNIKTRRGEDLYKIKEALTLFEKAKKVNQLPLDKKDINKLNIDTLFDLTFQLQNQNLQSNTEKEKETKKDAKKVFENNEWLIIVPQTEESACYYGKGTKWCTAGDINNQFDYYNRQGTLYIIINKQNPSEKYQFHFESKQFMDVMDRPMNNIAEFFDENNDIYNFFKNIQGDDLDFILAESSVENGDTEGFDNFYSDKFTDQQKRSLIKAAFERDSDSDGYYTVIHVLNYINYDGMEKDFRRNFLNGLNVSLGDRYDEENYNARLFIDMIGGFTYENIDDIIEQIDFKDSNDIEKIFEIAEEYDNGLQILNKGLEDNDKEINQQLLDTLSYLQNKFSYSTRNKQYASKLAFVKIIKITDFQKGIIEIEFIPRDNQGNAITQKRVTGNINYKNLIKYLTIPQIPLNKSRKKSISEKVTKTKVICDKCRWSWKLKDGGKDPYVCHKCGHDNTPKKKLKEEEIILNEKCWKGYTQKGMKTMFGKTYPNCVKKIK